MRMLRTSAVFVSGCIVYYVMAACSGSQDSPTAQPSGDPIGADGQAASSSSSGASGEPSSSGGSSDGSRGTSSGGSSGASGSPVPNAMADDWHKPGTRLKLRYYEVTDGAKQFRGWWDSQRNEECFIGAHSDGTHRCMPTAEAFTANYFSSSACSIPVAIIVKGSPTPKYASKAEGLGTRRHSIGATSAELYSGAPGQCTSLASLLASYDVYVITEIASSSFAEAAIKTAP